MNGSLVTGQKIAGRYVVENYLAEGGMQYVYIAYDEVTGQKIALKTPKNYSAEKRFHRSAIVSAKINHPNTAKTLDYVDENHKTYLIEEFIEGMDLKKGLLDRTNYLDPYLVAKIFRHLAKGVAAAHHVGVVHRDLKPSNIMITGGFNINSLKVTDFGIAKMAEDEINDAVEGGNASIAASATAVGALPYMAPEAINTPEAVGLPSDVWSVGAIILHLLYGDFPFGSGLRAVPNILNAKLSPQPSWIMEKSQFQPLAQDIISLAVSCLNLDPLKRPSCDELVIKCNDFCYTSTVRKEGFVKNIFYNSFGFINSVDGDVFFHNDSVYGQPLNINDTVIFSSYESGQAQAPRALPVIKLHSQQ
ncbi:serine/threonine protein kinase [Acetobacter pasteurianus]|uniref:Protein kinase n=3 Tax=Acetobacter TaxID=434 RepID=C7JB55_ACEP3|nr:MULTISPECIES: serine/threonine-protein kinase [Acetobacter]ASC05428.1 Non-specific serine/threonine protein kinase [Acetobacter pasteurianus subsp. pasteurianus]KFL89605.1 Protein kinase [Acetobacter malorum]OAG77370.1 protein kinase [Acetobacter malorum]BAH98331.1 protein kinase [Acetobacter pasteurianus IFO 3283-01]BAI01382.1 protein kinase [Acetobacter pasteurianus IFO 3283-03]